jgi:amidophosphoribosyltransferase
MGLVADVFKHDSVFETLPGRSAIGHVRYSTAGGNDFKNCQPIMVDYVRGSIAIAHNGNLVNAQEIRNDLEHRGSIFHHRRQRCYHPSRWPRPERLLPDRVTEALQAIKAPSLVFLTETRLVAVRDPNASPWLSANSTAPTWLPPKPAPLISSRPSSSARWSGEMILIDKNGIKSFHPFGKVTFSCIFEYIYFARPDSTIYGREVYGVRRSWPATGPGTRVEADVVIPIPDSGVPSAVGYAEESGIPFQLGLIRNHYVGRTFIEPQQSIRHFGSSSGSIRCARRSKGSGSSSSTIRSSAARPPARSSR